MDFPKTHCTYTLTSVLAMQVPVNEDISFTDIGFFCHNSLTLYELCSP